MIEAIVAALFGLLIGSFLNVCIYRMPHDLSVVHPRSFCPSCEKQIAWYDNLPVLSWVVLQGACRYCGAAISWRYPAVEALTGALFFLAVLILGFNAAALKLCVFSAIMVALVFMDFEERILADEFTLGGTVVGLIFAWFVPMSPSLVTFLLPPTWDSRWHSVAESLAGAVILSVMLWVIGKLFHMIRGVEGMGFGDVKMVACMGAFLGMMPTLMTVVLGSVLGSVIGLIYIRLSGKDMSSYPLPFGSFLGVAALVVGFAPTP